MSDKSWAMNALTEKWPLVETHAKALGVKDEALRKWQERGRVPYRWHLPLIETAAGKLVPADFAIREAAE